MSVTRSVATTNPPHPDPAGLFGRRPWISDRIPVYPCRSPAVNPMVPVTGADKLDAVRGDSDGWCAPHRRSWDLQGRSWDLQVRAGSTRTGGVGVGERLAGW